MSIVVGIRLPEQQEGISRIETETCCEEFQINEKYETCVFVPIEHIKTKFRSRVGNQVTVDGHTGEIVFIGPYTKWREMVEEPPLITLYFVAEAGNV